MDHSPRTYRFFDSIPRIWIAGSNQSGVDARGVLAQGIVSILRRACTANPAEHPRKVLLRFESARHGDIKNPHLGFAQHLLGTLYPLAQDKLVRALACRVAKHFREMRGAEPHGLRKFAEAQLVFHLRVDELFHSPQAGGAEPASIRPYRLAAHSPRRGHFRS